MARSRIEPGSGTADVTIRVESCPGPAATLKLTVRRSSLSVTKSGKSG
jgi:hypothetical protein